MFGWSVQGARKSCLIFLLFFSSGLEIYINPILLCRFGSVKSVNVVRQGNSQTTDMETSELNNSAQTAALEQNSGCEDKRSEAENFVEHMADDFTGIDVASDVKELKEDEVAKDNCAGDDKPDNILDDKSPQTGQPLSDTPVQVLGCENVTGIIPELPDSQNSPKELSEHRDDKVDRSIPMDADDSENSQKSKDNSTLGDADSRTQVNSTELDGGKDIESNATEKDDVKEHDFDLGSIFEVGCVFVEFGRTEASCMAAYSLHGRVFDERIVTVEYVALDHYKARFPK